MQFNKTAGIGSILGAALLAGGTAYYLSKNGMRVRRTIDNEFAIDRTTELARVSPEEMVTGAVVTVALAGIALWGYRRDWSWMKERATGLTQRMHRTQGTQRSSIQETEEVLDIDVPVSVAYNQWTQFEEFPRFMPTVESVKQIDDSHLHWKANVAGKLKEWDSEIVQQIPDQLIEWRSTGGVKNGGIVTFDKIREGKTRVKLRLWYEPQSTGEKVGGMLGGVKLTAKGNLKRFAQLLEKQGTETGAWRGEIAPQH
jgi:uncharacterized membrane protein